MSNIVTVPLNRGKSFRTEPLYQHDYGQVLRLTGIELPPVWEMHFSNEQRGVSVTALGAGDSVAIPDGCLTSGKNVYAWVYLHTGADDGETEYMITIPVIPRAAVGEETPTPVEQSAITEAIAALNAAAGQAARDAGRAETAANSIEGTIANALAACERAISINEKKEMLRSDGIEDAVQTISLDPQTGNISRIVHAKNGAAVRTDAFAFDADTVTEVRRLSTGESLTIETNMATLVTTVTYTDAV